MMSGSNSISPHRMPRFASTPGISVILHHVYFLRYQLMKIAICDDELSYLEETEKLVEQWADQRRIDVTIYRFSNGDDLIQAHQSYCMDLILLDIIMPLLNGMDTVRELRHDHQSVPVIFLTSSREYAVDSYEGKAFNYLMKPIKADRLFDTLDEFRETFLSAHEFFTAQTDTGFCRITLEDVDYLEAQNKRVLVSLSNDTVIEIRELFSRCEEIFRLEKGFFKCHRSYIVNLNHVEQFTKTEIRTKTGANIPISRNNYATFKEAYFSYMFR